MIEAANATWGGRLLERSLGRLFERAVVRRLGAPAGVAIVAVGGSTLGGSGKTPLAIECAAELARAGARVVLVGHAYRASPRRPRWVSPRDRLAEVGDEALLAARALEPHGARVVVGPTRAGAMAFAARGADVLVLDGVAQLAPGSRDARPPVGGRTRPVGAPSSAAPARRAAGPAGDARLRVRRDRALGRRRGRRRGPARRQPARRGRDGRSEHVARAGPIAGSLGRWGELLTWEAMRSLRVGLLVALGRPQRVVRWLERRGVAARAVVRGRDHGPFRARARWAARSAELRGIDVWLATPKCALHAARGLPGLPVAVLDHSVALDPSLRKHLRGIAHAACLTGGGGTNSLEVLESTRIVRSTAAPYAPPATPLAASGEYDDMRPRA